MRKRKKEAEGREIMSREGGSQKERQQQMRKVQKEIEVRIKEEKVGESLGGGKREILKKYEKR